MAAAEIVNGSHYRKTPSAYLSQETAKTQYPGHCQDRQDWPHDNLGENVDELSGAADVAYDTGVAVVQLARHSPFPETYVHDIAPVPATMRVNLPKRSTRNNLDIDPDKPRDDMMTREVLELRKLNSAFGRMLFRGNNNRCRADAWISNRTSDPNSSRAGSSTTWRDDRE